MRNRLFGSHDWRWPRALAALTLVAMPAASQALYPRDAPKQPGAPSWALERAKLPPFNPPRTPEGHAEPAGTMGRHARRRRHRRTRLRRCELAARGNLYLRPAGRQGSLPAVGAGGASRSIERGWREDGRAKRERLYPDPQTFCLYSVPRATYRGGFEIVQVPGYVLDLVRLQPLLSLHSHGRTSA